MSLVITIDGVDRTALVDAHVTMQRAINQLGTIRFTVVDPTGAYAPAQFDDVSIALTGQTTRIGTIAVPPRVSYLQRVEGGSTVGFGTSAEITAHDPMARAKRTMRNGIDVGPITLHDLLDGVVTDNLATVGVSLAAGQATGPTFDTIGWSWTYIDDLLNAIVAACQAATGKSWVWRIDDSLVLEVWEVGAKAAPQTLTAADIIGDIDPSADAPPFRNDQYFLYGPSEVRDVTETWVGDGSTRVFPMRYQVASRPLLAVVNGATPGVNIGVYGVDALEWTWDAAYGTYGALRQSVSYPVLTGTDALSTGHSSQFPNVVHVQDGTSIDDVGVYVRKDSDETITDVNQATDRANALMAASVAAGRRLSVPTHVHGCDPGEVVTLSIGIAAVNGDYLIERVTTTYLVVAGADPRVEHVLDLVAGDLRTDTNDAWLQRVFAGGSGSGAAAVSAGVGGGSTVVLQGAIEGDLGGSRLSGVVHTTWTPVREHREWRCPADGSYAAYVEVWTQNAATSVQPRIYDVTASAVAATGSSSSSTTPAKQQLVFTGVEGHDYRLELLPGNTSYDVYGLAKVRP